MAKYRTRSSQIKIYWSAREVHEFLLRTYGHGIFSFALSLAIYILRFPSFGSFELWGKRNVIPDYWIKIKNEIKTLESIREGLMNSIEKLDEHLNNILYWEFLNGRPNYVRDLIRFPPFMIGPGQFTNPLNRALITKLNYGLDEAIRRIDQELEFYKSFKRATRRKGRPIESKLVITVHWSLAMKKEGRTQWKDVNALMNWFHHQLRETQYASEITEIAEPEEVRQFKLKYRAELMNENAQVFRQYDNPNNPMELQISFDNDSPKLWGLGSPEQCGTLATICFPDGTTFS